VKIIKNIYENEYKKLLIIPFLLLILAFVQIGMQYTETGDFVNRGVSLKGGISVLILSDAIAGEDILANFQSEFPDSDSESKSTKNELIIEASDIDAEDMISFLKSEGLSNKEYTIEQTGSTLGASFFRSIVTSMIIAFILMGIVILLFFRTFVPSIAVILAAFSDIVITLAIFNMTGIKLTGAGIAAFLMLIGYSVDTDVLLSTRVLKRREGTVNERIYGSMKTGLTMSFTTIAAISVALIFTTSEVISQIMIILLIGLLVDLINTWIQNVGILRLYLSKKERS